MRNLHNILLQEDGIEARRLFRLWEKLKIRASDYRNHRIFTLRCLHSDLILVSIKLKSTIKSTRAKQILRKAEKELLQARIKSINFILDSTSQQLEECRSQLATIISTQKLRECQDFVDKVSENRFNKVKQRQINKLNLLTTKKEGNITRSNTNTNLNYFSHNHNHNHNSLGNSQVTPQVPPGEDNRSSQAGPPHREANTSPPPSHTSSQAREDSALPQAGATPPGEDASLSQVSTSHLTTPPSLPTSPVEDASLSQAITPLPPQPNTSPAPSHTSSQAGEDSALPQAGTTPPGEDASLSQVSTPPTPLPSQPTALLPSPEDRGAPNLPNTQAGQSNNPTNYPRQGSRHPPRQSPPRPPKRFILPPRKAITPPTPPLGIPRVLPRKNLTLSGSLTFPTNP